VPQNSYINIKLALADTTMKIGGVSHTFLSEKRMVQARLVNGKFVF
jgi:chemotaxis receptor (MCP) glutamine deamidase CheD